MEQAVSSSSMEIRRSAGLRLAEVIGNTAVVGMVWLNPSLHDGGVVSAVLLIPSAVLLFNALVELSYLVRGNPAVVGIADDAMTVIGPLRTRRFALSDVTAVSSSGNNWPGAVVIKTASSSVTLSDFEIGRKARVALAEFFRSAKKAPLHSAQFSSADRRSRAIKSPSVP